MNPHKLAKITQDLLEKTVRYDCICGWSITAPSGTLAKTNHDRHSNGLSNEGTLWDENQAIREAIKNLSDAGLIET